MSADAAAEVARLSEMLAEVRATLLGADPRGLDRLVPEIADLVMRLGPGLGQLGDIPEERHALEEVARRAAEASALAEAALNGLRGTVTRVEEIRRAHGGQDTYGPGGTRRELATPRPGFESRR